MTFGDNVRAEILKDLHNNLWGIIKHLIKVDTFIIIFVFILDLIMMLVGSALKNNIGIMVCYLFILLTGLIFSIYMLNNRRIHRQQIEALRNIYSDFKYTKYYPDKTTSMYSRRYDIYLAFILISTICTLLINYYLHIE